MAGRYVNDAATLEDGFGTLEAGDQVARMVLEVEPPFTLGITGKWGSGKTSILRRAFATLGGNPVRIDIPMGDKPKAESGDENWGKWSYKKKWKAADDQPLALQAERSLCVWYSPWQHQAADNPLIPLLLEIREQYTRWVKAKKKSAELLRRGGLAAMHVLEGILDAALEVGFGTKGVADTAEAVRKSWRESAPSESTLADGQRFHLLFEDAVETLLDGHEQKEEDRTGRLIVFIDDLDRCEEDSIVKLLQAIKLYLVSKRCVFVLALDDTAVLDALTRHWKGRSEDANRDYLEKLFQATVPVPVPWPYQVEEFLRKQLDSHHFPDVENSAKMIEELLEPNPRKIKNFINSACAQWQLFRRACPPDAEGNAEHRTTFAKQLLLLQYLRMQHRPIWRLIERQWWGLRLVGEVLTGVPLQLTGLPEGIGEAEQRMLRRVVFRSFAHVLKTDSDKDDFHGHIPIAEAVELLNQRIDRKRSDERFIALFQTVFGNNTDLPEAFRHLPRP